MIRTEKLQYDGPGGPFTGSVSWDDALGGARPGVLVAHTIRGLTPFEVEKAQKLAELGYVGFAIDNYGKQPSSPEEARASMDALNDDRPLLLARLEAALTTLLAHPLVDSDRTAAIGFCFGGKCALDLARSGADIKGAISFHGVYDRPPVTSGAPIKASILVLHGWEDPLATPVQTVDLARELTERGADWQIHAYGHTGHAFTNPAATARESGLFYNESADRRSWLAMNNFLTEVF